MNAVSEAVDRQLKKGSKNYIYKSLENACLSMEYLKTIYPEEDHAFKFEMGSYVAEVRFLQNELEPGVP